jgi:hypothetical protein
MRTTLRRSEPRLALVCVSAAPKERQGSRQFKPRASSGHSFPMKKYLNKENVTALVIVVVGVLAASLLVPMLQGAVAKFRAKKTA